MLQPVLVLVLAALVQVVLCTKHEYLILSCTLRDSSKNWLNPYFGAPATPKQSKTMLLAHPQLNVRHLTWTPPFIPHCPSSPPCTGCTGQVLPSFKICLGHLDRLPWERILFNRPDKNLGLKCLLAFIIQRGSSEVDPHTTTKRLVAHKDLELLPIFFSILKVAVKKKWRLVPSRYTYSQPNFLLQHRAISNYINHGVTTTHTHPQP